MSKQIAVALWVLSVFAIGGCGEQTAQGARIAPDFTLPRVGGGDVSLAAGKGTVRLVDFWATWCAPCREEIPMLNELQRTYGERGFQILAISSEDAALIEEFVAEQGVEYTNLVGTDELAQEFGAIGLPTAFLIDAEGRVAEVYFGSKPRAVLEEKIEELLAAS
jgi:thiol-disulfide isomerase/thioredoxin